jgi:hypothetical protein
MSDAFERLRDRYWELEERLKAVEARAAEAEQLHEESERRRVVSFNRAEEAEARADSHLAAMERALAREGAEAQRANAAEARAEYAEGRIAGAEAALKGNWGTTPMSELLRKCADEPGEVHHRTFFLTVADALDKLTAAAPDSAEHLLAEVIRVTDPRTGDDELTVKANLFTLMNRIRAYLDNRTSANDTPAYRKRKEALRRTNREAGSDEAYFSKGEGE